MNLQISKLTSLAAQGKKHESTGELNSAKCCALLEVDNSECCCKRTPAQYKRQGSSAGTEDYRQKASCKFRYP